MTEGKVPFKQQLDDICIHIEKCKIEQARRHSEFAKRFDDIVARHDRLTSGRIRRLSLEGIIVDIDSIRGPRREQTFCATGTNDVFSLPYLRRSKTEFDVDTSRNGESSSVIKDKLHDRKERHCSREVVQKTRRGTSAVHNGDIHSYKQLRLEISFDSKNPNNSNLIKPTHVSLRKGPRNRRNTTFHNSNSAKHNRNKFQKAYAKVIHIQRFTSQRRHTILSMAPIGLGENPTTIRSVSPNNLNNNNTRNGSPGFFLGSQVPPGTSGKRKFKRAIKKLENAKKFSNLIKERRQRQI